MRNLAHPVRRLKLPEDGVAEKMRSGKAGLTTGAIWAISNAEMFGLFANIRGGEMPGWAQTGFYLVFDLDTKG